MNFFKLLLTAMALTLSLHASAQEPPAFTAFATGDGAYFTTIGGQVVDPYFVNKGFIIALQANAPLQTEFVQWIEWLLPKQRKDGGFDRFCPAPDKTWRNCMAADADDSMAATTIEMLQTALRKNWVPAPQRNAAEKTMVGSHQLLARLRNPKTQLYKALLDTELYYLMDNVEVYEALRTVGGPATGMRANQLAAAIRKQFWDGTQWKPAFPEYDRPQFYPHTLASAYLWQTGVIPAAESDSATAQWLAQNGSTWLSRQADHYAWGLIAWKMHQTAPIQAACWRASLRPFQSSTGWTVLDAMIDLSLAHQGIAKQCPIGLPNSAPPAAAAGR